ncbi:DUF3093 domain-containing protein [Streptomyces chumphonensis]|uniref:DUF3093 domain-containing protein n=1 Tax=Streptomyces chumphonensis TaxID=1214925 RepID=A0A927F0E5_9ACTN|nr:DUF3093 domain-containing protein [Streptomyces chumphonensis]MBD3932690.1 DUF3093 domain-containing protein [Streptomyces chumphonensis]
MQAYDERLTAPRSWWLTVPALFGLTLGLVVLPLGPVPMLAALVTGAALAAAGLSAYGAVRVRVVAGSLVAGSARIPLSALGEARALDAEEARAWRSHRADPRAFMVLRAYIPTAVRVEVVDPQDPTPYVYLSTRRPQRLVSALGAAGGSGD